MDIKTIKIAVHTSTHINLVIRKTCFELTVFLQIEFKFGLIVRKEIQDKITPKFCTHINRTGNIITSKEVYNHLVIVKNFF